jgi:hypothetical protein
MATKTTKTTTTRTPATTKKATPARARTTSTTTSTKKSATPATSARTRPKSTTTSVTEKARKTAKKVTKRVGDVLGIGRARVPDDVPRATTDRGGKRRKSKAGTDRRRTLTSGRPIGVKM